MPVRSTTRLVAWKSAEGGSRGWSAEFFLNVFFLELFSTSTLLLSLSLFLSFLSLTGDIPGLEARELGAAVPLRGFEVPGALGELHQLAAQVREPPFFFFF